MNEREQEEARALDARVRLTPRDPTAVWCTLCGHVYGHTLGPTSGSGPVPEADIRDHQRDCNEKTRPEAARLARIRHRELMETELDT